MRLPGRNEVAQGAHGESRVLARDLRLAAIHQVLTNERLFARDQTGGICEFLNPTTRPNSSTVLPGSDTAITTKCRMPQ